MRKITKIKFNSNTVEKPKYETEGADGMDLRAVFDNLEGTEVKVLQYDANNQQSEIVVTPDTPFILNPGCRALIPTGIFLDMEDDIRFQLYPRSGLSIKFGITLMNAVGKVDSDYNKEVKAILYNASSVPFTINHGDRVCQGSFEQSLRIPYEFVDEIEDGGRGGFGSTGIKS